MMQRSTVLIADDDIRLLKALSTRLSAEGYEVLTCQDSYMATDLARRSHPDVIVLDMNMPAGQGYTAHKRLSSFPETMKIPIIYMTGDKTQAIQDHAMKLGALAVIDKPLQFAELLAFINAAIHHDNPDSLLSNSA